MITSKCPDCWCYTTLGRERGAGKGGEGMRGEGRRGEGGGVALSLDLSFDMHVNISTRYFHLKVIVFDKRVMMHNERLHIKYQKFRTNDSQVVSARYLQTKRSQKPEPKLGKNSSTKHFQSSKQQNIQTIPA